MSWSSSLRAGVVPRIQHLKRVNPATIRLASTSSSPPTLVQPSVVSTSGQQSASQSSHVSIKEDLKRSLQRTAANSQGAPIEDGLRILIFGKPVSRPLVSETSAILAVSLTRPSSYPAGFWEGYTFCSTGAKVRLAFRLHG